MMNKVYTFEMNDNFRLPKHRTMKEEFIGRINKNNHYFENLIYIL